MLFFIENSISLHSVNLFLGQRISGADKLFQYLNSKYFADFKLSDEGQYWETNDETVLKANFKRYTELIEGFASAIVNYPIQSGENIESYFGRVMKLIHNKKNSGK